VVADVFDLPRLARALTRPPLPLDDITVARAYKRFADACAPWTRAGPVWCEWRPARLVSTIDLSPLAPAASALADALNAVAPWPDPRRVACAPDDYGALVRLGVPTGYANLLACFLAGAREWALAAELGCVVPPPVVDGPEEEQTPPFNRPPPALVGRPFAELPNPKAALCDLACAGYVVARLRARLVEVWGVYGEAPVATTVVTFEDCCGMGCGGCSRVPNAGWQCPACGDAWVGKRERHYDACPVGGRGRIGRVGANAAMAAEKGVTANG
jgi:hypothetical protein